MAQCSDEYEASDWYASTPQLLIGSLINVLSSYWLIELHPFHWEIIICSDQYNITLSTKNINKQQKEEPQQQQQKLFTFEYNLLVKIFVISQSLNWTFHFLAAKRSSTPALVICLSVCPSVRLKTEFLTVWSAFDNLRQLMTAYDSF